jgi:hypothetical protein
VWGGWGCFDLVASPCTEEEPHPTEYTISISIIAPRSCCVTRPCTAIV